MEQCLLKNFKLIKVDTFQDKLKILCMYLQIRIFNGRCLCSVKLTEFATYWMLFTTCFVGTLNPQNARDFLILSTVTAQISVHHSFVLIRATSDHMTCLICIQARAFD